MRVLSRSAVLFVASSPVDQTATNTTGSTANATVGPTGTTTQANELIIGAFGANVSLSPTFTAGTGYTALTANVSNNGMASIPSTRLSPRPAPIPRPARSAPPLAVGPGSSLPTHRQGARHHPPNSHAEGADHRRPERTNRRPVCAAGTVIDATGISTNAAVRGANRHRTNTTTMRQPSWFRDFWRA